MSEVNDPIIQLIEEYLSGEMEDVRRGIDGLAG